ncbi:uncharacterized protein DS421_3g80750 [Arachis hypogaea]|nr:uncharacterized protein DS421_3g80750 [Arachis hypogaea]
MRLVAVPQSREIGDAVLTGLQITKRMALWWSAALRIVTRRVSRWWTTLRITRKALWWLEVGQNVRDHNGGGD